MMRRLLCALTILAVARSGTAEQHVFARFYDLNTPTVAATTNYIVTVVNLTNTSFALAHQPDVPRNVTVTIVDTTPTIVAGTITVVGTDVNDAAQTETFDLSTAITFTGVKEFKTITSVTSAGATVLGGAGDETIIVGVGSVVGYLYCATTDPIEGVARIKTVSSSTTVTTVNSVSAFGAIAVGDEIYAKVGQTLIRRVVTAKASSISLTIDSAASWANGTAGYPFQWRHRVCGYSDTDGWMATDGLSAPNVKVDLGDGSGTAITATGGLSVSVECRLAGDDGGQPAQLFSMTMTSAIRPTSSQVVPVLERCSNIRTGLKWTTVDTSGTDSVSAYLIGGLAQ